MRQHTYHDSSRRRTLALFRTCPVLAAPTISDIWTPRFFTYRVQPQPPEVFLNLTERRTSRY